MGLSPGNFPSYWGSFNAPAGTNWQEAKGKRYSWWDPRSLKDDRRSEMDKTAVKPGGYYTVKQGPDQTDVDGGAYTNYADFWNTGAAGIQAVQNVPGGNWPAIFNPATSASVPKNEFYGTDNAKGVQWIRQTGQDQSINHIEARNALETRGYQSGQFNTFMGSRNGAATDYAEQNGFQNVFQAGQAARSSVAQNNTRGVAYFDQLASSPVGFKLLEPEEVEQLAANPAGSRTSAFSYNFFNGKGSSIGADQRVSQQGGNGTTNHIVTGQGGLVAVQYGHNAIHSVDASQSMGVTRNGQPTGKGVTVTQVGHNAGKNLTGSAFDDKIETKGDISNYKMNLGAGNDRVDVNGMNNFGTIDGGAGNDTFVVHYNQNGLAVYGGGGTDTVQFDLGIDQYDITEATDDQGNKGYTVRQKGAQGQGTRVYGVTNYQFGGVNYNNQGMQVASQGGTPTPAPVQGEPVSVPAGQDPTSQAPGDPAQSAALAQAPGESGGGQSIPPAEQPPAQAQAPEPSEPQQPTAA